VGVQESTVAEAQVDPLRLGLAALADIGVGRRRRGANAAVVRELLAGEERAGRATSFC
jgi:hypothetical protein